MGTERGTSAPVDHCSRAIARLSPRNGTEVGPWDVRNAVSLCAMDRGGGGGAGAVRALCVWGGGGGSAQCMPPGGGGGAPRVRFASPQSAATAPAPTVFTALSSR